MPILLKLWNDIFRYRNTCDCHICSKCFFEIVGKPNSYQFFWPNFITFCDNILHKLLRPNQFLEKFMEIVKWPTCRNKSGHSTWLNVAAYWKSNNTDACSKRLSHIFANDSENMGRGAGLRIYLRYSLKI